MVQKLLAWAALAVEVVRRGMMWDHELMKIFKLFLSENRRFGWPTLSILILLLISDSLKAVAIAFIAAHFVSLFPSLRFPMKFLVCISCVAWFFAMITPKSVVIIIPSVRIPLSQGKCSQIWQRPRLIFRCWDCSSGWSACFPLSILHHKPPSKSSVLRSLPLSWSNSAFKPARK